MTEKDVPRTYRAFHVEMTDGTPRRGVRRLEIAALPDHDVLVQVAYSSLNYKDALSAAGRPGVTRHYPHTPGIDAAGLVVASRDPRFEPGDEVLCTGFDLGMNTPGGFAEYIRVPGDWLVRMPTGLDARSAMVWGTAGFTARMAVDALAGWGAGPELGSFVVTGASGGVGTLAVALLAREGFEVVASTGTAAAQALLQELGAATIMPRETLAAIDDRPLPKAAYGGGIDTVAGTTLANLVKRTAIGGAVAACGNVAGADLALNVFPFILRGVGLLGIDSQHVALDRRVMVWDALAAATRADDLTRLPGLVSEIGLDELDATVDAILAGGTVGRVLVRTAA